MKNIAAMIVAGVAVAACGNGPPSDNYLRATVTDAMHVAQAPAAQITSAEQAQPQHVKCVGAGQELVCDFDLALAHHTITFVKTGSGDWSPKTIK